MYGADLARIHHEHFGQTAEAAATELLGRLRARGVTSGTVVDLACGTGLLARRLTDEGFDVVGVDLSPAMLEIARSTAGRARPALGSLWDFALPPCVAVTAVGEAFNYVSDIFTPDLEALRNRLEDIARVLPPAGLLLFDVAGPGRGGITGTRSRAWEREGLTLHLQEVEDRDAERLTRTIETSVSAAGGPRPSRETHHLALFDPAEVEAALDDAGFAVERLRAYSGGSEAPEGWHHFAGTKQT